MAADEPTVHAACGAHQQGPGDAAVGDTETDLPATAQPKGP